MKPSILLAQIALVVLGLFVYDLLRSPEPTPTAPPGIKDPAPPAPREVGAPALPPRLGGAAEERIGRRLERQAGRLAVLESSLRDLAEQGARIAGPDGEGATPARPAPVPAAVPFEGAIDAGELARFRTLQEAARRQVEAEALHERLAQALDRLDVNLSTRERSEILDESARAWAKARAARARWAAGGAPVEDGRSTVKTLCRDYGAAIGRIVQGSHGTAIAAHLAPYLGLVSTAFTDADSDGR